MVIARGKLLWKILSQVVENPFGKSLENQNLFPQLHTKLENPVTRFWAVIYPSGNRCFRTPKYNSCHIIRYNVYSQTFGGDKRTLLAARNKINEEFKKNKHVQNEGSIDELLKMAKEVENELKANVIQAKEKEPGVYGNYYI